MVSGFGVDLCFINSATKMTKDKKSKSKVVDAVKPPSPRKNTYVPSMRNKLKMKKEKPVPTIRVLGFQEPLAVEAYQYTLSATRDGFVNGFRIWSRGELEVAALTDANFVGLKMRRDNESCGNEPLLDEKGFVRVWMIRYPPENESTVETRKEGLRVLKTFFMSKAATNFAPNIIKVVDDTTDDAVVLETVFLDDDIDEILKASFEETELDDDFYGNFTTFANHIYCNKEPSSYAKDDLGFPALEPV